MKRIKTVVDLAFKARRRGVNKMGEAAAYRRGHAVYRVIKDGDIYTLQHYGTNTIIYDAYQKELIHWYGEGVSDRDSMNTFLEWLGEERYYFRYGKNMGFIIEERD